MVINQLEAMKGLVQVKLVEERLKKKIERLEVKNNIGVFDCLKKERLAVLVHDSEFRDPPTSLVIKKKEELIFPSLPFKELKKVNAISPSPSKEVHQLLIRELKLKKHPEHATILIGFDDTLL